MSFDADAPSSSSTPLIRTHSYPSPKSMSLHFDSRDFPKAEPSSTPASASGSFQIPSWASMERVDSSNGDSEREDLTTKGRKRKRLAKACSACHKNKRRCDGFAPCSNCEFSSRPCLYLNAQGDLMAPPRTREPSIASLGTEASLSRRPSDEWTRKPLIRNDEPEERRISTLDAVDGNPALSAELIDTFIKRVPPYAAILHIPTFHHRLYLDSVSPILLDAIYALAARLCSDPALISTLPPDHPPWLRGEAFAERARCAIDHVVEMKNTWSEQQKSLDRGSWEELEFAQALVLLSCYANSLRQPRSGLYWLDLCVSILRPPKRAASLPLPRNPNISATEYLTLLELRQRTFWLLVIGDLCAAANGRPRRLSDIEIANVSLPGKEIFWSRYGGSASGSRDPGRRDCIIVGSGSWSGEEGEVGELGHAIRILSIFSDIMSISNNGGHGSDSRHSPAYLEQALKNWALALPPHLRFDEINLGVAIQKLESSVPELRLTGWLFPYMHAVAECGMFYLQAAVARLGATYTAQRQSQAVDNLAVILTSIGEKGREGPLMLFPIMVVSNWREHLRAGNAAATVQHAELDRHLVTWWSEAKRGWGLDRQPVQERGFFPSHPTSRESSAPLAHHSTSHATSRSFERKPSSLGLYHSSLTLSPGKTDALDDAGFRDSTSTPPSRENTSASTTTRPRAFSSTLPLRLPSPSDVLPLLSNLEHFEGERLTLPSVRGWYRSARSSALEGSLFEGRKDSGHTGSEPLGIAALVSAAEERGKEEGYLS